MKSPKQAAASGKTVVLGVGASISAFKGVEVLRALTGAGMDVWVCPSKDSLHFVGRATWESLSSHPIRTDVFEVTDSITHVNLAHKADVFVVVGATADLMARMRVGMGDEFLTLMAVTVPCPVVIAPSMHPTMWENAATQENVKVLKDRGWHFVGPESGFLADNTEGFGRLSEPEDIVAAVVDALG